MKTLTLEDYLLDAQASLTKDEMKPVISNIKIVFSEKFGRVSQTFAASDLSTKIIGAFGGIYGALKQNLKDKRNSQNNEVVRAYMSYVASEGIIQLLQNGDDERITLTSDRKKFIDFNVDFDKTDQKTIYDIVTHFSNNLLDIPTLSNIKNEISSYFSLISGYCLDKIDSPLMLEHTKEFSNLRIIGKNFVVDGIKKKEVKTISRGRVKDDNDYAKGLTEFVLDPVKRDDIVANEKGIELIEDIIPCLMHYNPKEQNNFFKGFPQYILFAGESGTGKTMLARYAMTYAKEIAEKHNLPLSLVKLEFEGKMQYGPVGDLRKQFSEIEQGNRTYIVFLDEIDKKIPSSDGSAREGYRDDIVGEFLRFRGGGDYINKGNYILIGTSNTTKNIHPAILSVCEIEEVEGPRTKKEKTQVLYNNLSKGVDLGYVQIKDWQKVGGYLDKYDLTGRDLFNISVRSEHKYRKIANKLGFSLERTSEQKGVLTKEIIKGVNNDFVTRDDDIINEIIHQSQKSGKVRNYVG